MSVAEFRTHKTTALPDAALQTLLDAEEQAITGILGPVGAYTELRDGGGTYLFLRWPAASITSVTERYGNVSTVLSPTDYELRTDGVSLRRLAYGPNASLAWLGAVTVVYPAADDLANRKRVQLALTQLDLNHNPGLSSERIGDWEEAFVNNSAMNYREEREAILATLQSTGVGFA